MLDQNTDRMWYVIGAVILGAAIILILNGTAPELFASVGDTFSTKTEEVTQIVDHMAVNQKWTLYTKDHIRHGNRLESQALPIPEKATHITINPKRPVDVPSSAVANYVLWYYDTNDEYVYQSEEFAPFDQETSWEMHNIYFTEGIELGSVKVKWIDEAGNIIPESYTVRFSQPIE